MVKHVAIPIREITPRTRLRGFYEDFNPVTEDVLVLAGETHNFRKPVCIDFW